MPSSSFFVQQYRDDAPARAVRTCASLDPYPEVGNLEAERGGMTAAMASAAEELEPYRVTSSPAMAAATSGPRPARRRWRTVELAGAVLAVLAPWSSRGAVLAVLALDRR